VAESNTILVVAWRAPVAWDGMTEVGGVSLSGAMTGGFALNELILHGWDLARATDQAFGCDPVLGQAALSFTTRIIEQGSTLTASPSAFPMMRGPSTASSHWPAATHRGRPDNRSAPTPTSRFVALARASR
jgi:uncharacterized protein (TIGR03086 family)